MSGIQQYPMIGKLLYNKSTQIVVYNESVHVWCLYCQCLLLHKINYNFCTNNHVFFSLHPQAHLVTLLLITFLLLHTSFAWQPILTMERELLPEGLSTSLVLLLQFHTLCCDINIVYTIKNYYLLGHNTIMLENLVGCLILVINNQ